MHADTPTPAELERIERHYHVSGQGREVIALDAASVDDAILDVTDRDPASGGYLVAPCTRTACVAEVL